MARVTKPNKTTTTKRTAAAQKPAIVEESMGRYINPLTDYGFKRIFGEEANKDLLIHFLNSVLEIEGKIVSLQYRNPEQKGRIKTARNAFLDLYCITGKGEHIIIEMQNISQKYFKDRVLYYLTFPIQKQAIKGRKWNFNLKPVYSVNILDFTFGESDDYIQHVQLMYRKTGRVFYDKLLLVFIELPDFDKPDDKLKTDHERWMYVLKHLASLKEIPDSLKRNKIFQKLFMEAEIANMTPEELEKYDESLKNYSNMYTVKDIVNDWRKEVVTVKKEYATLFKESVVKDKTINAQAKRIAELERKLGLNAKV